MNWITQVLPSLSLRDDGVTYSLCWTTDLDYFFHMNNGKYFREMDFARLVSWESVFQFRGAILYKTRDFFKVLWGGGVGWGGGDYQESFNLMTHL